MKTVVCLLILMTSAITLGQSRYLTKTGALDFEASVPSFEEVAAKNNSVTAILNPDNGDFAVLAFVKGFRFKNALMEEHFNENYAESDNYPKAIFKGHIKGFSMDNITEEPTTFNIEGELTFHGVSKQITEVALKVRKAQGNIIIEGSFTVLSSDFKIKIPKIVRNKVSEEVEVSFNFELKKK